MEKLKNIFINDIYGNPKSIQYEDGFVFDVNQIRTSIEAQSKLVKSKLTLPAVALLMKVEGKHYSQYVFCVLSKTYAT